MSKIFKKCGDDPWAEKQVVSRTKYKRKKI